MGSGDKNSSFSYLFQSRTQNPLALWSADGHNSGGIEKKKDLFFDWLFNITAVRGHKSIAIPDFWYEKFHSLKVFPSG